MEVSAKEKSRVTRAPPSSYYTNSSLSRSDENISKCPQVTLSWHDITVTHQKSKRVILNKVSGVVQSGQTVALMGASGAGKTTLLNTLLARNLKGLQIEGQVLVNANELGEKITNVSGYVQQEELFLPTLTVKEHLLLQARLRLVGASAIQRAKRVDEILHDLGLRKCRHTRIGINGLKKGISGGESKRLLFASELLNDPPLLFCDEPTTGLDSAMAESVVMNMRKLAERGHTIICTIHQPSAFVFNLFHQVMFLADGRLSYAGPPQDCVDIFARFGYTCRRDYNPADMVIETLAIEPYNEDQCRERISKVCEQFDESEEGRRFYDEVTEAQNTDNITQSAGELCRSRKSVMLPVQFWALLQRSFIDNWRNPALVRAKLTLKIFMGLFVGLLYFRTGKELQKSTGVEFGTVRDNINGALYFLVNELTYATTMGILTFLPDDYPLVVREYHDGLYYLFSYYVARCLSYMPLFTLDGLLMMGISYYMVDFVYTAERFFLAMAISLLIEQSAAAFGVMLSCCAPSYPVAIAIAAPLLTTLSLTGGMYANVGELPAYVSWMQYLSWFRYGFEAFCINQWEGVSDLNGGYVFKGKNANGAMETHNSTQVLEALSFSGKFFLYDLLIMAGLIFIFYAVGFLGLLFRVRRSR